jgi:hypothetical protein
MTLPDLTDQFAADSFLGILHTSNNALTTSDLKTIYDGVGNPSSLKLSNDRASIAGITYPLSDPGFNLSLMTSGGTNVLSLSSWSQIQQFLGGIANGSYYNPIITMTDGTITNITTAPKGIQTYTIAGSYTFTVPENVKVVKFIVTGGGGYAVVRSAGGGGTAIGYMDTIPGEEFTVVVGAAGNSGNAVGDTSSITDDDGNIVASATGGNTTTVFGGSYGGGGANIGSSPKVTSFLEVNGGDGGHAVAGENDRDSTGGSSYWGGSRAYGGGVGCSTAGASDSVAGSGIVYLEW